jgi:trehalose utilization protein
MRVVVWNEHRVEQQAEIAAVYPDGIHGAVADALRDHGLDEVAIATLDEPGQGLPAERLDGTDVLVWWGHQAHAEVDGDLVDRIQARVLAGMGLVVLHSGHLSKPFLRLMGTSGRLRWRLDERERLWVVDPGHPIAVGVGEVIELDPEEMYGEPFDIPAPDELVAISSFAGGEVFRSVCTWRRGRGRVVYLRPGDERYPTYHQPAIRRLLANAVRWAGAGV